MISSDSRRHGTAQHKIDLIRYAKAKRRRAKKREAKASIGIELRGNGIDERRAVVAMN